jgi:hypothetical protein
MLQLVAALVLLVVLGTAGAVAVASERRAARARRFWIKH